MSYSIFLFELDMEFSKPKMRLKKRPTCRQHGPQARYILASACSVQGNFCFSKFSQDFGRY
ncbi:uncharacterized protein CIMG_11855 [Coccidioides immitis RS]|uniref:Uncharacterized protein n=4 Tax=Coccidioides immitis TaxID=5501 RepID=A0A0D8JUQ2_COCIM|nr:uncharacterized protein CIMG_11855 [Coccidioides immitis RS]KJF60636.1 hypothetical protein CIMG_11855 [Coccidioides immitis RS]KMP04037.1 hypothetical protein CIRG_03728 [Coccidioides immitis RMSCC 2394]KMU75013.1 hypothetical protein CISG_00942 [Coccidioides immitis RMSCC 3703]KMU86189.1 hypothetical protein CIHG_03977 [Coccidioides immitis H538.4]